MSISVSFTTESKKENSTKQRTMSAVYDCTFKNGCSMLSPTLFLEINSNDFPPYTGFAIGNKYYNVTDIKSVRNNLFEVSGKIDVLATYKTDIGNDNEYVVRASAASDEYIIDTKYPAKANPDAYEEFLPNINQAMFGTEGGYVIGTISPNTENGVTYSLASPSELRRFFEYLFGSAYLNASEIGVDLQKELINPFQYIASCTWFPFLQSSGGHFGSTIKFGFWDSGIGCTDIEESNRIVSYRDTITQLIRHPQALTRGRFLDSSPFTKRKIEAFSFGTIPLDPSYFIRSNACAVEIKTDLYTGIGELIVESGGVTVVRASAQIGVPIKLSQISSNFISSAMSAVGAGVSAATDNFIGAAKGIGNALKEAMPQVQTSGSTGSKINFARAARITSQFYPIVDEDNETMGRPLCAKRTINTLSGYIQCENVDISLAASSTEREEVIRFMENGFFYE